MSIYNADGTNINACYDVDASSLSVGYDVDGEVVFNRTIRVMSYNVQRWEGYNGLKSIQAVAFNDGADIIGIQEWGTTEQKTIEGTDCVTYLNGFGYSNVSITTLDVNHKAIASKIPFSNYSETVFSASHETRSYSKAYITINGKQIAWFNTHTDYQTDSYKYNQIQALLSAVEDEEYFILTGDLNTTCTNKSDTEYQNCVQPFIDEGYNVANSPVDEDLIWTYYNGETVVESTQITPPDNIITSANIDITNVHTIDTKLTAGTGYVIDHIPIVADLIVN